MSSPLRERAGELGGELRAVVRQCEPAVQSALGAELPPTANLPERHPAGPRVHARDRDLRGSRNDGGREADGEVGVDGLATFATERLRTKVTKGPGSRVLAIPSVVSD